MTKTLLYENENELSTSVSSITLNEDFSNYKYLVFVFGYTNATGTRYSAYVDCEALEDLVGSNSSYYFLREADCFWNFYVTNYTTFTRRDFNFLSPKAVYGVK